ncbi:uncharacterized protein F4807DRAFT_50823 [Annulohypoxylon truncatum]|uniref:uncharacterized protein n=1 Tax=Annulohypoxylon truncatum TaxID=327061 RepID=UPI0020075507|nr:uncharacterized protein F4807DRAFT_50823 [Annulohypoxylon truncatum]KAI1210518.1 hypothetical protein F4807DRAFT_50823 [Annulohypoxylon truncatum]
MCVEVWNTFQRCNHRVYQNTFPCSIVRQCAPDDDLSLKRTKFLPDKTLQLPPGPPECKTKMATRPLSTKCPVCAREERMAKAAAATTNSTNTTTTTTSTTATSTTSTPPVEPKSSAPSGKRVWWRMGSRSSSYSHKNTGQPATSPSPGGEGIERVRDSLAMLDQFRKTSL